MTSIRNFLPNNALYLASVLLITIITLQIVIIPRLNADDVEPLPLVDAVACASSVHAYVTVTPYVANWSSVNIHDHGLYYEGIAIGQTPEENITSWVAIRDENGETVWEFRGNQKIWIQVVFGDVSVTKGLSAQEVIGLYLERGKSIPNAATIGNGAYLDDWYSLRSTCSAMCEGNLDTDTDWSGAEYHSFMIIGFTACDNASPF
ncbi:MAG: hypothetical protein OXI67_15710 [Candidatus Poribacteria bacterium]|nr:hypothetical protein [Candidatus Poribacteria bacterium]